MGESEGDVDVKVPWYRTAGFLIHKILRFNREAEIDERYSKRSRQYKEYFLNCAASNRQHAMRYQRKLLRWMKRCGM